MADIVAGEARCEILRVANVVVGVCGFVPQDVDVVEAGGGYGGRWLERLSDVVCIAGVARLRVSLSLACYAEAGFVACRTCGAQALRPVSLYWPAWA